MKNDGEDAFTLSQARSRGKGKAGDDEGNTLSGIKIPWAARQSVYKLQIGPPPHEKREHHHAAGKSTDDAERGRGVSWTVFSGIMAQRRIGVSIDKALIDAVTMPGALTKLTGVHLDPKQSFATQCDNSVRSPSRGV